jgi:hypothetical protein
MTPVGACNCHSSSCENLNFSPAEPWIGLFGHTENYLRTPGWWGLCRFLPLTFHSKVILRRWKSEAHFRYFPRHSDIIGLEQ